MEDAARKSMVQHRVNFDLSREFRRGLANLEKGKGFNFYTPKEQAMIHSVLRGGPADALFNALGIFAPSGIVSAGISTGAGAALGGMYGGGPLSASAGAGAAGLMALGTGARQGANLMARTQADTLARDLAAGVGRPSTRAGIEQAVLRGAAPVAGDPDARGRLIQATPPWMSGSRPYARLEEMLFGGQAKAGEPPQIGAFNGR